MAAITAAVVAAAAIGGSIMQAEAARKAANEAKDAQKESNFINLAQYIAARGGDPSAVLRNLGYPEDVVKALSGGNAILPMYAGASEKQLYDQALAAGNIAAGNPTQDLATYQGILASQQPAIDAGNATIADIYNGAIDARREEALAPVLAARLGISEAQRQAIELALAQERSKIEAADAAKGFTGSGSVVNNRLLQTAIAAREAAATGEAQAKLVNAQAEQALKESGEELRLKSLDMPVNRASQLIALSQAPGRAVAENAVAGQQPLQFFKVGVGSPPTSQPLPVSVVPNAGAVALSGVAQAAGGIGTIMANQQAANRANAFSNQAVPDNWGSMTPAQQQAYVNAWQTNQGAAGGGWE